MQSPGKCEERRGQKIEPWRIPTLKGRKKRLGKRQRLDAVRRKRGMAKRKAFGGGSGSSGVERTEGLLGLRLRTPGTVL